MEPILQTIFLLVLILLQYRLMAEDVSGLVRKVLVSTSLVQII